MDEIELYILTEDEALTPSYASSHAAGADVRANCKEPVTIEPGATVLIPTGLKAEIPEGYEIQVRPRSGLALKHSVTVLNTPGTIDSDYRGEIQVILINHGKDPFVVLPGMRIAQLVVASVIRGKFIVRDKLEATTRGTGGFGHTGVH